MNSNDESNGGVKLLDAVETLSSIVETPWETESYETLSKEDKKRWKDMGWLKHGDKTKAAAGIRNIFKVILIHLKSSFQEKRYQKDFSSNNENIKSIMMIVGKAAKKIDRFTDLFHNKHYQSVTETQEYRQLQDFYNKKISKTIDEALLGKWILALTEKTFKEQEKFIGEDKRLDAGHVYVDLDSVKNDTEYELFFIRKQDGTRFFNARLIRNISLICDFGFQIGQEEEVDPLSDIKIWADRFGFAIANRILQKTKPIINCYFHSIFQHRKNPLCASLHKALLALYSAGSRERLMSEGSSKGCLSYFKDFQIYLREALETRNYQHLIAFPDQEIRGEDVAAKKVIDELLKQIFELRGNDEKLNSYINFLVNKGFEMVSADHKKAIHSDRPVWSQMACEFLAFQKCLKKHLNGPLNKVLSLLEEGDYNCFDPYMLQRISEYLFTIEFNRINTQIHTLPSPTNQDAIHQAQIIGEWLGYLRAKCAAKESIVLINFQDNTSWREYARSQLLEKLQEAPAFKPFLNVITLPKDTEFYLQEMPYDEIHQLEAFRKHLKAQILENNTGFFLSEKVKEHINEKWIDGLFSVISRYFFSSKNVLSKDARLNFLEIFYAFIELKIIEVIQPSDLFFVCKDGIDICPSAGCTLYVLTKFLKGTGISQEESNQLTAKIYQPALLSRERALLTIRAERMLNAIKVIETAANDFGDKFTNQIKRDLSPFLGTDSINI